MSSTRAQRLAQLDLATNELLRRTEVLSKLQNALGLPNVADEVAKRALALLGPAKPASSSAPSRGK